MAVRSHVLVGLPTAGLHCLGPIEQRRALGCDLPCDARPGTGWVSPSVRAGWAGTVMPGADRTHPGRRMLHIREAHHECHGKDTEG